MTLDELKSHQLIYVGTPYTRYPGGIEAAFVRACQVTSLLIDRGLNVYSPIAHTHPIAVHGGMDPLDVSKWLAFDAAIMAKSDAMIVAMLDTWDKSTGVAHEIATFEAAGKPVVYLDPTTMTIEAR